MGFEPVIWAGSSLCNFLQNVVAITYIFILQLFVF